MHFPSSFLRAGALALSIACLSVPAANAVVITVDSQQYDVTTITGTYLDLAATLHDQVWWGSEDTALSFANAVGTQLGFPNGGNVFSPLFAFEASAAVVSSSTMTIDQLVIELTSNLTRSETFAVATPVRSVGVPDSGATVAMLGLALSGLIALRRRLA